MKKVLVLGASGATGRLVVQQLREKGVEVTAVVRRAGSLPATLINDTGVTVVERSVSEMLAADFIPLLNECSAVACCLGHNVTLKGMFGDPRRLVADCIEQVSQAIKASCPASPIKLVLMNSTGNANRDIPEVPPISQRVVIGVIRLLVPPHADNEAAADVLRLTVGQHHPQIEWAAVRPDSLTDDEDVSGYALFESPTRNAIFNAAPTSRINVAHFIARLTQDQGLWEKWQGKMPVIYNQP